MKKKSSMQALLIGLLAVITLTGVALSCNDDDNDDRKDITNGDVVQGVYEGTVTLSQQGNNRYQTDFVRATVRNGAITFANLPVRNWIAYFVDDPLTVSSIVNQIGTLNYSIPFQKARYATDMNIQPRPLTLSLSQGVVGVAISVPEPAVYIPLEEQMHFSIQIDSVMLDGVNTGIPVSDLFFRIEED